MFDSNRKLIEELRSDYKFIENNLNGDSGGFWSRTFIRTTISLIEAELFILKQEILTYCEENSIQLNPELLLLLNNKKYEINSNGQIKERLLQVRLKDDIKFSFSQIGNIKGHKLCKDFEDSGWSKVVSTILVRNRLTHPKMAEDINVSKQEVNDCKHAFKWFIKNLTYFLEQEKDDIEEQSKMKINELKKRRDKIIDESSKST